MNDTLRDLREDLAELAAHAHAALERLRRHIESLEAHQDRYRPDTRAHLLASARALLRQYEGLRDALQARAASAESWTPEDATELIACKAAQQDMLRTLQSALGSVLSAGNWQSPSFSHTRTPEAGEDTGKIYASANDYKRDLNLSEEAYAAAFRREYIDHALRLPPEVLLTGSGMAAVATVLTALRSEHADACAVVAGRSSYFQNKWVLERLFGDRVTYVDEFDTEAIVAACARLAPKIVFLDSVCGAESLPIPNLRELLPRLARELPADSALVLDNTGMGSLYQPLSDLPLQLTGMRCIVVESLVKYHQFGWDRAMGGVIWEHTLSRSLFEARMHLGTIIPDATLGMLPTPNRALLERRLRRIGRNARLLAERLDSAIREGGPVEAVVHPSLPEYPGYAWTKDLPFQGGFVALRFKEGHRTVRAYDAFVARAMEEAGKGGVQLVGGTSFGFNATRVYVTARHATNITQPFVRISAGTETMQEIESLAEALAAAIR